MSECKVVFIVDYNQKLFFNALCSPGPLGNVGFQHLPRVLVNLNAFKPIWTSGAQWLSGRVLDSRPKGDGFEPHRRHCVVSLSKSIYPSLVLVQPRKTRPFITERLLMGRKESNQTKTKNHMDLNIRKPVSVVCEQQRCRPACASAQADQRLCYSFIEKHNTQTCHKWNLDFLASLHGWAGWFESQSVGRQVLSRRSPYLISKTILTAFSDAIFVSSLVPSDEERRCESIQGETTHAVPERYGKITWQQKICHLRPKIMLRQ